MDVWISNPKLKKKNCHGQVVKKRVRGKKGKELDEDEDPRP
jgi:hypothetical protein